MSLLTSLQKCLRQEPEPDTFIRQPTRKKIPIHTNLQGMARMKKKKFKKIKF